MSRRDGPQHYRVPLWGPQKCAPLFISREGDWLAIAAACVGEIRPGSGSDNNGGFFKAGATGTDRSQQAAAHANLTTLSVVNATTTIITVSLTDYTVIAADVGNVYNNTGGSSTAGLYEITAVDTVLNLWTLDRSIGTAGQTCTGAMGGALASVAKAAGAMVAGNKIFATGSETRTATTTLSVSSTPSNSAMASQLIGYTSARGDGGQYTITLATNSSLTGLSVTGNGWWIDNVTVDCASLTSSTGISLGGAFSRLWRCKAANFKTVGLSAGNVADEFVECEVTGGLSGATAGINATPTTVVIDSCNIHDNVCPGIIVAHYNTIINNLITNNTGASSDGIQCTYHNVIQNNTIHGNGRHGISNTGTFAINHNWRKNSISGSGGYGIVGASSSGMPADPLFDGNAFGYPANTSGTRNNADSTSGVNATNPYTNTRDVSVTVGSQYVDAATNDWDLNATVSQGALLRGTAKPNTWLGNSVTQGADDFGAVQHADPTPPVGKINLVASIGTY